ncbi:unnamed protein product [Allacma fusca]|uniref:Uncharacterized protein n=1 Tax=Allacma fusca TaxID=39272 RepID=A0A8J2K060_9HEXA|nr:unnamed protein product [Allacma fusca]
MSDNSTTVVNRNPQSSHLVNEIMDLEPEKSSSLSSKVYEHFDCNENTKRNYFKRDESNSTGNLMKHIKRKHKSIYIGGSDTQNTNQKSITQYLKPKGFSKDELEARLLNFVIMTNQPFAIVESPAVLDFALYGRELNSLFNADTLKRKIVRLYHEERDALIKTLQKLHPDEIGAKDSNAEEDASDDNGSYST